jgi:hypothetical protein
MKLIRQKSRWKNRNKSREVPLALTCYCFLYFPVFARSHLASYKNKMLFSMLFLNKKPIWNAMQTGKAGVFQSTSKRCVAKVHGAKSWLIIETFMLVHEQKLDNEQRTNGAWLKGSLSPLSS